jgi:4-hydroxy-tetrahydrodipicolinate synthase
MSPRYRGAYTATVTPFSMDGKQVDYDALRELCEFQVKEEISGIVSVGTTGESPTLTWEEHLKAFSTTFDTVGSQSTVIASTGSNSTAECLEATKHAIEIGIKHVLLVDPYYNGPSSLEIRREYIEPVASAFPETGVIPYIIPGRSGTQLLAQDLAISYEHHRNVSAVKEATGDFSNMQQIRSMCGPDFVILSGDDDKTLQMTLNQNIRASGVISVASNVAPKAVQEMCQKALTGAIDEARSTANALQPLFDVITVKTTEQTHKGTVNCKARNPLPVKTLMGILGMPVGPLRPPMGRMTKQALNTVLNKARKIQAEHPEIFEPLARFFDVDVDERLSNEKYQRGWFYDDY